MSNRNRNDSCLNQALGDFQNVQTQTDLFETESHTNHSDTHSQIDIDTSFWFEENLSTEDEEEKEERDDDNKIQIGVILLFTVHVCLCY